MSLYNDAYLGTLTRESLKKYIQNGANINSTTGKGDTALGLAVKNGHTSAVSLLLKFGAQPDKKGLEGKTPLYLVSTAPKDKRLRLAQLLLHYGADINEPVAAAENQTPIMAAITDARDPELIRLLVEKGASLTQTNDRGETAKQLAGYSMNPAIQRALLVKDPKEAYKPELGNLLTSAGLFAVAYFSDWKDVAKDSIDRIAYFLKAEADQNKDIQDLRTVNDFKNFLYTYIDQQGLEDFYPANDPRIQAIAEAAARFRSNPLSRKMTVKQFMVMAAAQLYTPVLYIDDSGSMAYGPTGQGSSGTQRIVAARHLVSELMDILDFVNPNAASGVTSLRFINKDIGNADNLTSSQVKDHINSTEPSGSTDLGKNLRAKVVNPLIYNVLDAGQDLPKPYIIMTIGDGRPEPEPRETFRSEVAGAASRLVTEKYSPRAVKFTFSQIGQDGNAEAFRDELINNPLPNNTLYVSSERFDQDYDANKGNPEKLKENLINWLGSSIDIR